MGPVKTGTKQFIKDFLRCYYFHGQSIHYMREFTTDKGSYPILATGWNDGKIKTIVSSCGNANIEGEPHMKMKSKNEANARRSAPASTPVSRDAIAAEYYFNCGEVDMHNRHRQGTLALEERIKIHCWRL